MRIASSAVGPEICAVAGEIKNISQLSRKRKKRHDTIVLLAKTKLYTVEVLISKALINSYIDHDQFISVNNVLRENNEIKENLKILKNAVEYTI